MNPGACSNCGTAFGINSELVNLPQGQRIAFDKGGTRVWRICTSCGQWNLLGREAAASALPELELRFPEGLLQHFDGIDISNYATGLVVIRLSTLHATESVPNTGIHRDDTKRHGRMVSVSRRTRNLMLVVRLAIALVALGVLGGIGSLLVDGGTRGLWPAGVAVCTWISLMFMGTCVWNSRVANSGGFLALWREPDPMRRTIVASIGMVVLYFTVAITGQVYRTGLTAGAFAGIFGILGAVISVLILLPPKERQIRSKGELSRLFALGILSILGTWIAIAMGHPWWVATATVIISVGFVMRSLVATRRIVLKTASASGRTIILRAAEISQLHIHWHRETQGFTIMNLPMGDSVEGDEARRVVRDILQWHNDALPPAPQNIEQAWKLVRAAGDLRGVLGLLTAYSDGSDGRFGVVDLPPTYRLALDFALADLNVSDRSVGPLRDAAEAAAEVAREAELLDDELPAIPDDRT